MIRKLAGPRETGYDLKGADEPGGFVRIDRGAYRREAGYPKRRLTALTNTVRCWGKPTRAGTM